MIVNMVLCVCIPTRVGVCAIISVEKGVWDEVRASGED